MPVLAAFGGISNRSYGLQSGVASAPLISDFESIATITAGSAVPNIQFSDIPQTYTHLQIRGVARDTLASGMHSILLRFNGDSGNNYTYHGLIGDGASATSGALSSAAYQYPALLPGTSNTANAFSGTVIDILDYRNTNKHKVTRTISGMDSNGSGNVGLFSGVWLSTSAITSITLFPAVSNNFVQNTSFALYGLN